MNNDDLSIKHDDLDFLYYDWLYGANNYMPLFDTIPNDTALKGISFAGFNNSKRYPNLDDFNLEELMCAYYFVKAHWYRYKYKGESFNSAYSSYFLKHIAEHWLNDVTNGRINYISNGTLIIAMHLNGFKFKRLDETPNCVFNISKRELIQFRKKYPEIIV